MDQALACTAPAHAFAARTTRIVSWITAHSSGHLKRRSSVVRARNRRSRDVRKQEEATTAELTKPEEGDGSKTPPQESSAGKPRPSRDVVLKACYITSGAIAAAGLGVRQASHFLAATGWLSSPDCTVLMPFDFLTWHSGAAVGVVAAVSVLRQVLLKAWPDFAFSSQEANEQVLSSLEPLDYASVAFASGVSEELLFRGALLPLLGMDTKAVVVSGTIFGALHLTGGRNVAFAIWASLVGIVYGAASVWTSDLYVPMASHSLANLAAALLWKYSAETQETGPQA